MVGATMSRAWDIDLSIYPDESSLLEGLRSGDRYACSCMLKRFGPRLYRVALQMTGDPDEAEDVLQEALIRSCDHIDDFEGMSALGTWLHSIIVNTALMHLRRRKSGVTLATVGTDNDISDAEVFIDVTAGPSDDVLSAELRERMDSAVLALPDTLRLAFVLREVEGLSTKDAAAALGISESALKVRLHRARLALREVLAPYLLPPSLTDGTGYR
jgi:RNA polymerase sigma-70 factor (ECF subfamily)